MDANWSETPMLLSTSSPSKSSLVKAWTWPIAVRCSRSSTYQARDRAVQAPGQRLNQTVRMLLRKQRHDLPRIRPDRIVKRCYQVHPRTLPIRPTRATKSIRYTRGSVFPRRGNVRAKGGSWRPDSGVRVTVSCKNGRVVKMHRPRSNGVGSRQTV